MTKLIILGIIVVICFIGIYVVAESLEGHYQKK